jgi:FAD/FMN-containing dehydrogenase
MTIESTSAATAESLRGLCGGAVHLPGDPGYDGARVPWNVAVDQRPAAVAYPANPREVSEVVVAAARAGLRVAPQTTGHNAAPLAAKGMDDVVLVRTSAMTNVTVGAQSRIARAEGGALWLDAVEAATPHGLIPLHGSSPDVGIAGYSLGGGIGWYARKLGLATNSITAVELVTADGAVVRADADTDPALFWALRGGGGNFGIVTALEFALYPIETAYAGMLIWDRVHTEKVLRRWVDWTGQAPDEVTTSFRVLNLPPLPELPELLRGRQIVMIDGAVLGSDSEAESILSGLRELSPEIDTFGRAPAGSLIRMHMDPEGPTPAVTHTSMLGALSDEAIATFVSAVGPGSRSSLLLAELRQLGGALSRPHPGGGGALSHLEADFVVFAGAIAATPELAAQGYTDAVSLTTAMAPWATGRQYLNFAEDAVDPRAGYTSEAWKQLSAVRSMVDPDGVFAANHTVPRLYEGGQPAV